MRFKVENILTEASLSRIHSKVKDENVTFAVIGSQDKDTYEDRWLELRDKLLKLSNKSGQGYGYNIFKGNYTYENGETGEEYSAIIYGIPKEDALRIADQLNQESIIWKDKDFFGFIDVVTRKEDNAFSNREISFDKELAKLFGSRLKRDKIDHLYLNKN